MELIDKYTGRALEYYLKQKEPEIFKLKYLIDSKRYMTYVSCFLLILCIILEKAQKHYPMISEKFSAIEQAIPIDVLHSVDMILGAICISGIIICLLINEYVKQKTLPLITDYIGNITIIKKNTDKLESLINKSKLIKGMRNQFDIYYAFQITEGDIKYNLYFFGVYYKYKNSKLRRNTLFEGIAVVFNEVPQETTTHIAEQNIRNVSCIKNKILYISRKSCEDNIRELFYCNRQEIREWAYYNIIELVKIKSFIQEFIEKHYKSNN